MRHFKYSWSCLHNTQHPKTLWAQFLWPPFGFGGPFAVILWNIDLGPFLEFSKWHKCAEALKILAKYPPKHYNKNSAAQLPWVNFFQWGGFVYVLSKTRVISMLAKHLWWPELLQNAAVPYLITIQNSTGHILEPRLKWGKAGTKLCCVLLPYWQFSKDEKEGIQRWLSHLWHHIPCLLLLLCFQVWSTRASPGDPPLEFLNDLCCRTNSHFCGRWSQEATTYVVDGRYQQPFVWSMAPARSNHEPHWILPFVF